MTRQSTTRIGKRIAREVDRIESDRMARLLWERRWCYVIPTDAFIDGHGYRVSIVIENEQGHYPTGSDAWIDGDGAAQMPWFWGMTYAEATRHCDEMNTRLGYSPLEAAAIVASTMGGV